MTWPYVPRSDGLIAVTLDNNVWNYLFEKNVDVAGELPCSAFAIFITREVEIETSAIPDIEGKAALKDYIAWTIAGSGIKTTSVFGFARLGPGPQRFGGFGQGTFQSQTERDFYNAIRDKYLIEKPETGSQLTKNEADAAVAAQSFSSIVLTWERRTKPGPLRFASEQGGKVLYLRDLDPNKPNLGASVAALHRASNNIHARLKRL